MLTPTCEIPEFCRDCQYLGYDIDIDTAYPVCCLTLEDVPQEERECEKFRRGRPILTARQYEIFMEIIAIIEADGYPPTLRELADTNWSWMPEGEFITLGAVRDHVAAIESKGYIDSVKGEARSISLPGYKVRVERAS